MGSAVDLFDEYNKTIQKNSRVIPKKFEDMTVNDLIDVLGINDNREVEKEDGDE